MKNSISVLLIIFLLHSCHQKNTSSYDELNAEILNGWNTWDNRSILTQVLLPEGLALTVQVHDTLADDSLVFAFTGNRVPGTEKVRTIAHTPDGSYTDFSIKWRKFSLRVQTVTAGSDLHWRIIPDIDAENPGYLKLSGELLYKREGEVKENHHSLIADLPGKIIRATSISGNGLIQQLNQSVYYSTNEDISAEEIIELVAMKSREYEAKKTSYGDLAETWDAVQNAVNWLVVYDPQKNRAVTPVSRPWTFGWGGRQPGGYVLFCWDNFFAAYMHSLESKELAFNEAIQMCREIDDLGFVPNFSSLNNLKSRDRSQPPVGSMMVLEIYKRHPEEWFLHEVFDRLLTWNRWWKDNRDSDGYLCWGSNPFEPVLNDKRELTQNNFKAASNESGLDNTPMYDGVPFDTTTHLLQIADVGLMGMYIGDCEALAELAAILNRPEEETELRQRAEQYRIKLKTMWDDDFGLFLNRRLDTGQLSKRISPTNFYALIGKTATQAQAERMVKEHFYNPDEFWGEWIMPSAARNDTAYTGRDYWRGSIWAPMNFLVYWGMRNYDLTQARKDLAEKSNELFLHNWNNYGYIRENYHAEKGEDPGYRSEHFYHWGALLGMIALLEL